MSGDVAIARAPRVRPAVLVEGLHDLRDAVRDRVLGLETEDLADLVERDLVVTWIFVALHVRDVAALDLPLDLLDEHLLRVVLARAAGVEDLARGLLAGRIEHGT